MSRLWFVSKHVLWLALALGLSTAHGLLAAQPSEATSKAANGSLEATSKAANGSLEATPKVANGSLQSAAQQPKPEALKLALKSAEQFLSAMDQRDYASAWDQSAKHFKASVSKEVWVRMAGAAREPLGEIKERRAGLSRATKDLPKGPAGEYIIINFETDIAIEPITEMLVMYREDAQNWRCIGYFVRPR